MEMNQITLSNMKIIYIILLLMNFLGAINGQNESESNNANFEKTLLNNRKRKLQEENYIIVIYNEDVQYSSGFKNSYRSIDKIIYNDDVYGKYDSLSISANQEIKIYISEGTTILNKFFSKDVDQNLSKLTSVDFSHFNSSLITGLMFLFQGCASLQNINFLNFDTSKVESMDYMFYGCESLLSLNLSSFHTSSVISMSYMFTYCKQLISFELSNFDTSKVETMEYMFRGCSQLESIDYLILRVLYLLELIICSMDVIC